ncbi:bifunctional [glutamate--ammonia ligase]-adenylyl-L-tyrosine phosphorylase/[glutamate--ammonia-ligase] adenylyltransferase [Kingella kingae]|uniref:bifunctional [glutamate--ammonia ligase]-adenylyl-L-tyrosine phosphorylase/[glutamate--ammonia-ligase] adenylyltransferase n=2 Tax=Kingella kingae TaxID=504 RepID=UPI0003F4F354|nr:bifunctional [glutamate--ammonia ligase]-adenylyl-L-tyrosine phosphorylase/[glutamate--ammonia-ligase] adenylyltransferase [Kingella kingae]MDK4578266.1 bifunctional [glutamate--ammonia ligase]-adenylyl-L-tyrosine phosphorylase/[glutamate--ammonia-ligase] adenylyltransferase [Kingella kingae]MDK4607793.1 bifunctional [glutamate--ammonia ligase]-adenylyl-L-tyrosine phosphorylase/[glutamate--ammonia-ligase] adenylyltransferase [Kingella kingae]MDK4625929.1 bifunctional [glutamate--ammonia ligas
MPLSTLYTATPYSQWLTLQLDNQRLNLDILSNWLSRPIMPTDFADFADWQHIQSSENEEELAKQLRLLRRNVMAHIMTRDLCRQSDLAEVTRTITELADFAINTALSFAYAYYVDMYGTPIGHYTQEPQQLSVVAMGKAGGFELNVSSDIDLIFIYPENGDTNGKRERTNQEFFTKVGQKLIALLDEITADGQVFRVDMRLRPDGDSGALVCSEAALEQYLVTQGREWERYAWCKGRVVTPFPNDINGMIRPFVFRKYLDYNAYDAMRDLHRQIRQEVQKRGMTDNVKLGAGGIREVEFIAQIFQMIRGGQNRALQLKGTQETLLKLAELGILDNEVAQKLLLAYRFLRDVEHRLQYWDDQQTQTLPESESQQHLLAKSMGFATWAEFAGCLNEHRALVNQQFSNVLDAPDEAAVAQHDLHDCWKWNDSDGEKAACTQLARLGYADAERVVQRLAQLRQSTKYRQLSVQAALRFDAIVPRLLEAATRVQNSDNTLFRLLDFLETISRRSAYLAFLQQYPQALAQLADLMSQSAWLAAYLQRHPILLDELLSAQLMERLDWQALRDELASSLHACDDTEAKMDVLRHFQHAQTFRLTVQDLAGLWTVEALSDELSHLADLVLAQTLQHVWQDMPKTHCESPKFAIIGYGKLGGKELGYASDLDLVYLYEDDDANAIELYTKLSRRLSTWLSGSTGAGTLYDIDLRLRPNGDAGFLAHSLAAFDKYQHEQAWTWEHQSLTRGRFICGDTEVGRKFEQIRRAILTQPRDTAQLKRDIIEMREKMFATHPPVDDNVKYARGGVVDVEFIVQYLVLSQSHAAPELLENYGNIALLNMAAQRGLIDANLAEQCRAAYRHYRQQQHNKNLRDWQRAAVDSELLVHYEHVKTLWAQVFGEAVKMG